MGATWPLWKTWPEHSVLIEKKEIALIFLYLRLWIWDFIAKLTPLTLCSLLRTEKKQLDGAKARSSDDEALGVQEQFSVLVLEFKLSCISLTSLSALYVITVLALGRAPEHLSYSRGRETSSHRAKIC